MSRIGSLAWGQSRGRRRIQARRHHQNMKRSFVFFLQSRLTGFKALTLTLLLTGAAALLCVAALPLTHATPFMPASAAVIILAWFCGFRQGVLSALLSSLFVNYYMLAPYGDWSLGGWDLLRTGLWLLFSSGTAFLLSWLREHQDQARLVLAGITEGFFILGRDWNVVYMNDSAAHCAGKSSSEMTGRNYWEVTPETKGTVVEQQLRRCAAEGIPVQFENRTRRQRWLHIRAYPFADGISVFFEDISDAKEREARLRESLDRLSKAYKAAQMGTFEWNVKTGEIIWSDDTYRVHGVTREQFDGTFEAWVKSIHPEDLPGTLAKIQRALEDKSEYSAEYRVIWPNGEIHWFGGHGQVMVDEQGNATAMVGICSDVTPRHLEEQALRRSEKLATAGRLAATIAHEINNPLEAVTNLVYLMRQDAGIKPDTRDMLRLADEQLARVNHIAKQTLGFYQDRNVPEAVDMVQTLEGLLSILQSRINAKQLRIERDYENACLLKGFRGELRQVLSNLLTNAIDASPSGGKLIVRVKPERNGSQVDRVYIEVEDFGSGILPADRERIFEPFFTTKSDFGTGLGLWVTKELVEKHGGTIAFRSNSQNGHSGTCFSVMLPASMSAGQVWAAGSARPVAGSG
jgi:PAS domain S-box-containing protein